MFVRGFFAGASATRVRRTWHKACGLLGLATASTSLNIAADERPAGIPDAFVEVRSVVPDIVVDLRYVGTDNFMGHPVDGYTAPFCWMTRQAAEALAEVQAALHPLKLSLKVFDAYRPQTAVNHFVRWAGLPANERLKRLYYPDVAKDRLFDEGYIAERSGHSRGSTVDLTIISIEDGEALDMGTPFDFFDPSSGTFDTGVTPQQRANRLLLKMLMERHGFVYYPAEWWHFTLADEPFPDTYFDFPTGGTP